MTGKQFRTIKEYGNSSSFPPNWKKASPDEFWAKFLTYGAIAQDVRQMEFPKETLEETQKKMREKVKGFINARLFFYYDGSGLAMVHRYNHLTQKFLSPFLFKFALCEHEMVKVDSTMRGLRKTQCHICGYFVIVDAAD